MGLVFMHRRRRLGATLALLGMAFYAVLLPWHTVSQATLALDPALAWADAAPMCHSTTTDGQQKPGAPKTHCPICSGFAALQFALAGAWVTLAVPTSSSAVLADGTQEHLTAIAVRAPQSRGPPPPLA
jgi:hypothetical protein